MPIDKIFTDQLGREISVMYPPQRIISLVPSQTELLFNLGLAQRIIGITKFCTHPAERTQTVPKIGGTKKLDIELIKTLNPDLIIANKEENDQGQVEELLQYFPVWISDISDLDSALKMIQDVGEITNKKDQALHVNGEIKMLFRELLPGVLRSALYLIWRKPYMLAGKGTFIDDMLRRGGFANATLKSRYPEITIDEIVDINPELIFLSSEPYPFKQKHIKELQHCLPAAKICLVDGEMFSWYGSRLLKAVPYFKALITTIGT